MSTVEKQFGCGRGQPSCIGPLSVPEANDTLQVLQNRALEKQKSLRILTDRIGEGAPNLIEIRDELNAFENDIKQLAYDLDQSDVKTSDGFQLGVLLSELESNEKSLLSRLGTEPLKAKFKEQEKWIKAGFDKGLLVTDPEAVHFAVETNLIYKISMFEKSAQILQGEKLTIKNHNGFALFKVEGEWVPYSDFKDRIIYSKEESCFIGWNFVHPLGFIPRDWAAYDTLYPIAQITEEAYRHLKAQADKFWSKEMKEVDSGVEKGYILQPAVTGRDVLPRNWLTNNFLNNSPEHGSARIFTPPPECYVYSFGTKMRGPDEEILCHPETYLVTGISNVPTPDYEESRMSDDRLMTAVPMSKDRFEKEMDFIHRANKGLCFNFSRQNCVRFVETILRIAGVEMSTKISIRELFCSIVPHLSDVPLIGKPVAMLCDRIYCVVANIFDTLSTNVGWLIPSPVKKVFEWIGLAVSEILLRIEALFWTTVAIVVMGASRSIVPDKMINANELPEVETFHRFMNWSDIGNPEVLRIYYASKLREWIRKQPNSVIFKKPEYGFCCLDPTKGESCLA